MATKIITTKRNKAASIARIVTSTAELFAEKGYNNTTYTEIAKRANLNISLISRYFGTKENLLFSAVEYMTHGMRDSLKAAPAKPTFEEEVYALIDTIVDQAINESNKIKAICSTAAYNDEFKKKLYNHTVMPDFLFERLLPYYPNASGNMKKEIRSFAEGAHNVTYSVIYFMYVTFGVDREQVRSFIHHIITNMMYGMKSGSVFLESATEKHD